MEDLLEEIVGNIYDEFDPSEDAEIEKRGEAISSSSTWRTPVMTCPYSTPRAVSTTT